MLKQLPQIYSMSAHVNVDENVFKIIFHLSLTVFFVSSDCGYLQTHGIDCPHCPEYSINA